MKIQLNVSISQDDYSKLYIISEQLGITPNKLAARLIAEMPFVSEAALKKLDIGLIMLSGATNQQIKDYIKTTLDIPAEQMLPNNKKETFYGIIEALAIAESVLFGPGEEADVLHNGADTQ